MSTETFKIQVSKGWTCPPILKQISPSEWTVWLDSIAKILTSTEARLFTKSTDDFKTKVETELKYEREKLQEEFRKSNESLTASNKALEEQIRDLKKTNMETLERDKLLLSERYEREVKALKDTLDVFEQKNNQLLQQLNEAQKQSFKYFEERKQELEAIYKSNFHQEQQLLAEERKEISEERKRLEEEIQKKVSFRYESQISNLVQTIETLKQSNTWQQTLETTFKDIQTTIQPIKKMYQGSNEEKGTLGEKSVFEFITSADYFADGLLKDTSNLSHYGDMHFNWRTLRCLIEVKNKKKIATTDITKFESDIRYVRNNAETPCNCALFVALTASLIEEKTREKVQVEIIHGIPAVYLLADKPEEIQPILILLEKITKLEKFDQKAITQKITEHFLNYKHQTETMIKFFSGQISLKQREIKIFTKHLNELYTNIEQINIDVPTFVGEIEADEKHTESSETSAQPDDSNGSSENKTSISTIGRPKINYEDLKKYYIEQTVKTKKPTKLNIAQYFGMPLNELEVLFNAEIEKKICYEFLTTVVDPTVVSKLVEFKIKNNSWPTRAVLVRDFISDAQLRKLNKFYGNETMKTIWAEVSKKMISQSSTSNA